MSKCEVCGNECAATMQITLRGETHTFDCFECAIHGLAPRCAQCGCVIIGHGMETVGRTFCCANCARQAGVPGLRDNEEVLRV